MTVRRLAWLLLWQVLRGRGSGVVYVLPDISELPEDVQRTFQRLDFRVTNHSWAGHREDRFLTLAAEAESGDPR